MNYLIRRASWSTLALQCSESFLKNLITLRKKKEMSKNEEDKKENFERSNKELLMLTLVFPDMVGPTNIRPCLTTVVSYN